MDTVKVEITTWLSETLSRYFYNGHDVALRIRRMQERLGDGDRPHQDFLKTWLLEIDEQETYRASEVMNHLLDLYNVLSDTTQLFDQDAKIGA